MLWLVQVYYDNSRGNYKCCDWYRYIMIIAGAIISAVTGTGIL